MNAPDPTDIIRVLSGESVFDLDTDSKIVQAANEVSARAMFELFQRCDTSAPKWAQEFAEGLMEITIGDPSVLIGFDDGRWQGREGDEEDLPEDTETSVEFFLRLEFSDVEACFYQFHLFPTFEEPFIRDVARKRADESQFIRIGIAHSDDLQVFIQNLRHNPFLVKVHESSAEEFIQAPSHAM